MDYCNLALEILINDLHEFACQVGQLYDKLIENKEKNES